MEMVGRCVCVSLCLLSTLTAVVVCFCSSAAPLGSDSIAPLDIAFNNHLELPSYPTNEQPVDLPPGWQEWRTGKRLLYLNHLTRTVHEHWDDSRKGGKGKGGGFWGSTSKPAELAPYPAPQSLSLPPGIVLRYNDWGLPFLVDHIRRTTRWSLPGRLRVLVHDLLVNHDTLGQYERCRLLFRVGTRVLNIFEAHIHPQPAPLEAPPLPCFESSVDGLLQPLTLEVFVSSPSVLEFRVATCDFALAFLEPNGAPQEQEQVLLVHDSAAVADAQFADWVDIVTREFVHIKVDLAFALT